MNLKDAKIHLTINLEGGYKQDFVIDKNGKKKRIFHIMPKSKKIVKSINLPETFTNFAISDNARLEINKRSNIFNHWKRMNPKQRLEYFIKNLVSDVLHKWPVVKDEDYSYKILI